MKSKRLDVGTSLLNLVHVLDILSLHSHWMPNACVCPIAFWTHFTSYGQILPNCQEVQTVPSKLNSCSIAVVYINDPPDGTDSSCTGLEIRSGEAAIA